MPLLTQRQAIKRIREEAGLSEASAIDHVRRMAKVPDQKRMKVRQFDVEVVIAETNAIPKPPKPATGGRPFSAKKLAKIRAYGVILRQRA